MLRILIDPGLGIDSETVLSAAGAVDIVSAFGVEQAEIIHGIIMRKEILRMV